jgi:hypothetical protein
VDDVFRRRAVRRDRVDDRDGPLERHVRADSHLLDQLTSQRIDEALARVDAAAG